MCPHVYQEMDTDTCTLCGKPTHKTDWKAIAEGHKQWWADGKGDWSVCKDCGGTIRGWWSI